MSFQERLSLQSVSWSVVGVGLVKIFTVKVEKGDNKPHYKCLVKNDIEEKLSQKAVPTVSK